MTKKDLLALLEGVRAGSVAPEEAALKLRAAPFEDLGFAKVDHGRALRQGAAEVVYGEGKTAGQVCAIVRRLREGGAKTVLATRLSPGKAAALAAAEPDAAYDPASRLAVRESNEMVSWNMMTMTVWNICKLKPIIYIYNTKRVINTEIKNSIHFFKFEFHIGRCIIWHRYDGFADELTIAIISA